MASPPTTLTAPRGYNRPAKKGVAPAMPPHPAGQITHTKKSRKSRGTTVDFASHEPLQAAPLPPDLAEALTDVTDPATRSAITGSYVLSQIAAAAPLHSIATQLGVTTGDLIVHMVSGTPTAITSYAIALKEAGHRLDSLARQVQLSLRGQPKYANAKIGSEYANGFRCEAEHNRRLAESLMRRVSALDVDTQVRKTLAARKQATDKAAARAHAERKAKNALWDQLIRANGRPLPSWDEINRDGTKPSGGELDALLPIDLERLEYISRTAGAAAAQAHMDAIRNEWRAAHRKLSADVQPSTPSNATTPPETPRRSNVQMAE